MFLFWRVHLVHLLDGAHPCAGERVELTHVNEQIARPTIEHGARLFKQFCFALCIQPAADLKDCYGSIRLHLFRRNFEICIHRSSLDLDTDGNADTMTDYTLVEEIYLNGKMKR